MGGGGGGLAVAKINGHTSLDRLQWNLVYPTTSFAQKCVITRFLNRFEFD